MNHTKVEDEPQNSDVSLPRLPLPLHIEQPAKHRSDFRFEELHYSGREACHEAHEYPLILLHFQAKSVCQGGHLFSQQADLASLFFRMYNTLQHNIFSLTTIIIR
jgi:hypothetical protein